jgi:acetyl esterase
MPLDPGLRALLDKQAAAASPVPLSELPIKIVRPVYQAGILAGLGADYRPAPLAEVRDAVIEGSVPVRIYRPDRPAGAAPPAAVAYAHGGGWVLGGLETHDEVCRYLSRELPAVLVAADYRLAPEHPYPAAIDDYWTVVRWLAGHAAGLGADPGTLVVMGDSAGGNLAAAATLRARDAGGPAIAAQALAYPVTDATRQSAADPGGSYAQCGEDYGLTAARMDWFITSYLPGPASRTAPDASPLLAPDLSGLPPAVVGTAEFDPLRDEGARYAARLRDAGVPVTFLPGAGLAHGFMHQAPQARAADQARQDFTAALRAVLGRAGDAASPAARAGP